ncbi:hypothetical protein AHIS2_p048 [Acaryochloris phage A-HIS2]|nr:hypothetical protein AHIS2_p048 [Acaryochloris phage A-HIS2]
MKLVRTYPLFIVEINGAETRVERDQIIDYLPEFTKVELEAIAGRYNLELKSSMLKADVFNLVLNHLLSINEKTT